MVPVDPEGRAAWYGPLSDPHWGGWWLRILGDGLLRRA